MILLNYRNNLVYVSHCNVKMKCKMKCRIKCKIKHKIKQIILDNVKTLWYTSYYKGGDIMKDKIIQIRVTATEHADIKIASIKAGFDTVSAYILNMYRNNKGERSDNDLLK